MKNEFYKNDKLLIIAENEEDCRTLERIHKKIPSIHLDVFNKRLEIKHGVNDCDCERCEHCGGIIE